MDRFVTRGAPLPTFTGLLKRTDEAKENKRKHPTPSNGSTSVSITYNTLPGACSKKSKFVTPTDVQGKKLPLSGLSLRGIHGCAAQRPKLAPLSREKDCVSSLSASRACEAGGDGYVSLSSDEDAGEPTSRSAHNGDDVRREGFTENMIVEPKPSSAAAEDSIDWDPPPAAVGEGSSDPLADIISARQVGMALYLRRTARLSSKKTLAECGPVYDTYQQSLAHAVARGARGCLGRPPLLTPSLLTTVLADRLAVLPHLAIVGPDLSPGGGGCCKIQFDSQGVLVAVGRMHGVLDVYDMDECLQVVNQRCVLSGCPSLCTN